ncbi:MAG: YesL family protein [Lachnospiraceae bacterium]|nr:YesL family protein [Lachnospiraceae bacterium]
MERLFSPDNPVIRFLGRVCDLMILSVLFTLSCMLIVPSGAAMTALYTMTLKMVRNEEGETIKGYLTALRNSFLNSAPGAAVLFLEWGMIFVIVYALYTGVLLFSPLIFIILCIVTLMLTSWLSWLFPLQARFENHFSGHCRNAAALSLTQLPVTSLMTLVNLLPLLSVLLFPNRAGELITFWILFGFGGCAFVNSIYLRHVFGRVEDASAKSDL